MRCPLQRTGQKGEKLRKKNIFLILLFLFYFVAYTQSIQGRIDFLSDEQGKKSFVFSGETSLPEKTSLVASIWYEGQERLETRSYSIVQKGKFSFHYGPVLKPFPSGSILLYFPNVFS